MPSVRRCARRWWDSCSRDSTYFRLSTRRRTFASPQHIAGHPGNDTHFDHIVRILGIAHRLSHKPYALSGGEQQRVAIARAIVNKPRILLADEPTGNLDSENSMAVLDTLKSLHSEVGQTVLMITHNPEAAAYCTQRIVHMKDGRIV